MSQATNRYTWAEFPREKKKKEKFLNTAYFFGRPEVKSPLEQVAAAFLREIKGRVQSPPSSAPEWQSRLSRSRDDEVS